MEQYKFKSSAAIPRIYRLKFGRDIFVDMQKLRSRSKFSKDLKDEMQKNEKEAQNLMKVNLKAKFRLNHWRCLRILL